MTDYDETAGIRYWAVPDRMPAPVELDPEMQDVMLRVKRGAALLDEVIPGWDQKIDLNVLVLSDPALCVLGQVYAGPQPVPAWKFFQYESPEDYPAEEGSPDTPICIANYGAGRLLLGLDDDACEKNGFLDRTIDPMDNNARARGYDRLDAVWAQLIRERRAAP